MGIDETLGRFKKQARDKFPDSAAYIAMCQERLKADSSAFLSRWPGFIFNSDSSGNFYDFPEDLYFDVKKADEKRLGKPAGKIEDSVPVPSLQQMHMPMQGQVFDVFLISCICIALQ